MKESKKKNALPCWILHICLLLFDKLGRIRFIGRSKHCYAIIGNEICAFGRFAFVCASLRCAASMQVSGCACALLCSCAHSNAPRLVTATVLGCRCVFASFLQLRLLRAGIGCGGGFVHEIIFI